MLGHRRNRSRVCHECTFSKEACMSGQQKTWCVFVALLAGSLPGQVQAGGEAKTGPKPLPPDVVKAWTAAGLEVGWMDASRGRLDFTYREERAPAGAVPAFCLGE